MLNVPNCTPDHTNIVNPFLSSPLPTSLPTKPISPAEIVSVGNSKASA